MERQEFNDALKRVGLSKKDFAELIGAEYGTVNNWGTDGRGVPYWVTSWIENYSKSKAFDIIADKVDEVRINA